MTSNNIQTVTVLAILTALRVNVSEVSRGQLSLSWASMAPICPSTVIRYAILTDNKSNCGNCTLSPSGQTSATCSITPSATSVLCTFTVQSFVCNDSNPTTEDSVNVTLKGIRCMFICTNWMCSGNKINIRCINIISADILQSFYFAQYMHVLCWKFGNPKSTSTCACIKVNALKVKLQPHLRIYILKYYSHD